MNPSFQGLTAENPQMGYTRIYWCFECVSRSERIADTPQLGSRVFADMRVMPCIHVVPAIVILRGAAVALLQSDGSGLLGCQCVLIMVSACELVLLRGKLRYDTK